jgi:hypothetical protein
MSTRLKLYLYIVSAGLIVMLGIGVLIGVFAIAPALQARTITAASTSADAEAEYHRGLYDICRSVLHGSREDCIGAVAKAQANHWYEQQSDGWSWPPAVGAAK